MRVRVNRVTVSDGTTLTPPEAGMVLLVGPNNAGKSQFLKDLAAVARDAQAYSPKAIAGAEFDKSATGDVAQWVAENIASVERSGITRYSVQDWAEVPLEVIVSQWDQPFLNVLTGMFILHLDGTSRLTAGDSQNSIDLAEQTPTHPVQIAYSKPELERALDEAARTAFNTGVTVDRYAGSVISLRIGEPPTFTHNSGRPSDAYLAELKALARLEDQGDGVRSYLGLLLHILAGFHQVLLIDEPEAFLHPPQARLLGTVLAQRAQEKQVFAATHSSDIVRGALGGDAALTLVRITRDGDVNHAAVLSDASVKTLWSDPLLRYSNLLDGLFHDAVVLCEGDADCRFYAAVLEYLPSDETTGGRDPQLLFTHCGGKARMPSVITALRAASVPVVAVADFDVLRESVLLRKIVDALGGTYESFDADQRLVATALANDTKPLRRTVLKDALVRKIDELPDEVLTPRDVESLRSVMKSESGWEKAKRSGQNAVPQGPASNACERLIEGLRDIGLHVVDVGELERFVPRVAGHGPAWVASVLEEDLHQSPGHRATDFVSQIRSATLKARH